jgi:hypothetical protein
MKIKDTTKSYVECPEYNGIAKIVDITRITNYSSKYGEKKAFRFLLEINKKMNENVYWTVTTRPFTPSIADGSSLRKFIEKLLDRKLTIGELISGFDVEDLIGKYCLVQVKHMPTNSGIHACVMDIQPTRKQTIAWNSNYIRYKDREYFVENK